MAKGKSSKGGNKIRGSKARAANGRFKAKSGKSKK